MAKREIPAIVETTDDFTGKVLTADDQPTTVSIVVTVGGKSVNGGKPYSLDSATAMAGRLTAFLADPSDENRRALGDVFPRSRVGGSAGSAGKGDGPKIRAWANTSEGRKYGQANGLNIPEIGAQGRLSPKWEAGWKAAGSPEPVSAGTAA